MTALAVECSGLSKHYADLIAVQDLDLALPAGCFFGLLGPNGSGKTTTIHMLSTLVKPTTGSIRIAGHALPAEAIRARGALGLVFQESALDRSLTVAENLRFAGHLYGLEAGVIESRMNELLSLFDLTDHGNKLVGALSGGMRRAVDIARGVLHRPQVLFLDEPTIGLDIINRRGIWRFIKRLREQHGMTVLLTTHYLEEAEPCDQVAFLQQGRLIGQGKPQELTRSLAHTILEIETDTPAELASRLTSELGAPVREDERLLFAIRQPDFPVSDWQQRLQNDIRSLRLRKPDLNDVYVWQNAGNPAGPDNPPTAAGGRR
ncbi:MAG: ABC transporter ATP-binding protein [Gammaproteobacteria bacterium]